MKLFAPTAKKRRRPSVTNHDDNLLKFRQSLPVYAYRKQLLSAMNSSEVLLVTAETGSGKSTQIPQYLLNSPHRMAVTQPRRVAAMTLAGRVAEESGSRLGHQVGYRVRFDDCTTPGETQLVYVTDGMLLREAMVDPLLRRYSVIFLDEAHERSLATDILLGVVYRARKARHTTARPLQVVVMSATLNIQAFKDFFGSTKVIAIPGRTFDVQVLYAAAPVDDYLEAALSTTVQIHRYEAEGDVLVFLPGQEEIEDMAALLRQQLEEEEAVQWTGDKVVDLQDKNRYHGSNQLVGGVLICLLYAALPPEAQLAAFDERPPGCMRKIILATNIAETSVTLPAIRYVVDPGKHKCRHVLATGMESLTVEDISQAQAAQRAGRAGRVQEGMCFRLYTEDAFARLPETSLPDILRVNLAQVILQLKGMGISDPTTFDFVTKPEDQSLRRSMKMLYALSALDDQMNLTNYGKQLAKLPLDPIFGHLLLQSVEYSCSSDMLTAVAVLSAENLFYRPAGEGGVAAKAAAAHRRFASHEGDLPTFLNVYGAWQQEAVYIPPSRGGLKAQKKRLGESRALLPHNDWCQRNYISGRALVRAYHVRQQLRALCAKPVEQNGLGMDVTLSCGKDRAAFCKCVAAGLFLQAASRIKNETEVDGRGRSGLVVSTRGRYQTKLGNEKVSIHPTSTMFGRNPAPACVVYTELVTTKRTYIRGVTQVRRLMIANCGLTLARARFSDTLSLAADSRRVASRGCSSILSKVVLGLLAMVA